MGVSSHMHTVSVDGSRVSCSCGWWGMCAHGPVQRRWIKQHATDVWYREQRRVWLDLPSRMYLLPA
jgi:hypothetical protein